MVVSSFKKYLRVEYLYFYTFGEKLSKTQKFRQTMPELLCTM